MRNDKQNMKYALAAFWAVVIFVILYKYSLNLLRAEGLNDLREHTLHAQDIHWADLREAWLKRPYLLWHLCVKGCIKLLAMPVTEASAFVCSAFAAFNYFVSFYLLDRTASALAKQDTGMAAACVAAMLSLVQPMYVYWFNSYQYEGQFSINPIFNPTHMAVKPLGLLCFMLAVDLIRRYMKAAPLYFPGIRSSQRLYALFAIVLLLSAFTKPTFMYMFLPAGVSYLTTEWIWIMLHNRKKCKELWGFCWRMALVSAPSLVYLAIEYAAFYFWGGTNSDAHVAIYPFLTAWHIYSPNVPKSLLLSMAFPFWIVLTNRKYFLYSVEGRLSVVGYIVGTLEFSFLVETGFKLSHLNFAWSMMSGMLLIWVISAACLIHQTTSLEGGRWSRIAIIIGWVLLTVHLFSGLYYINPYMYII